MKIRSVIHRSFTAFLAVWLSGVVLLFCCGQLNARASEGDHCPLAKMAGHCSKAEQQTAAPVAVEGSPECFDCAFLPVLFDKARKLESPQKHFAAPVVAATLVEPPIRVAAIAPVPSIYETRLADSRRIFIRNRVLRI